MRLLLNRRDWLRFGTLAGFSGLTTLTSQAVPAARLPGFGKAKSVLVIHTSGGMSQFETWDPKPNAPVEIRGAFASVPTSVPGVRFGEHMPRPQYDPR